MSMNTHNILERQGHHAVAVRNVLPPLCGFLVKRDNDLLQEEQRRVDVLRLVQHSSRRVCLRHTLTSSQINKMKFGLAHLVSAGEARFDGQGEDAVRPR